MVLDDSTLDKSYAKKMELVNRHWFGKHYAVVRGINLATLFRTDGDCSVPCDYRLYDRSGDGLSKNDHFCAMLGTVQERGFALDCVALDGWYSWLENLKLIFGLSWRKLTRPKVNRRDSTGRETSPWVRRRSPLVERWSIWKDAASSGSSGSSPKTGTLSTGRRTSWRWSS